MQIEAKHKVVLKEYIPREVNGKSPLDSNNVRENDKKYFTIFLKPTATGTAPSPIRFFDYENYMANKVWYDTEIVVNGGKSYEYILNQVINNGYLLWWMKITWRFNNLTVEPQMKVPFIKVWKDSNGRECQDEIFTWNSFDIYQQNLTTFNIDMSNNSFLLDGETFLQYELVQDLAPIGMSINMYYKEFKKSDTLKSILVTDKLTQF